MKVKSFLAYYPGKPLVLQFLSYPNGRKAIQAVALDGDLGPGTDHALFIGVTEAGFAQFAARLLASVPAFATDLQSAQPVRVDRVLGQCG